jgi:D-alanyl-D-alanine carboxypeptidase
MTPEITKKEKFLAVLTVAVLFTVVGLLLFSISYNNKLRNEALTAKVLHINTVDTANKKLEKVSLLMSTTTKASLSARSFLTVAVGAEDTKKVLAERNPNQILPIASITKLMVALVALDNLNPETKIKATLDYIGKEESAFVIEPDRSYTVMELITNALVSSDNDSARLLSSALGENNFITKMNTKAVELGLSQTHYVNVTGLDPQDLTAGVNASTATDLLNLIIYIKKNRPGILEITAKPAHSFCDSLNYCKLVTSTNKLLADPEFGTRIIGGKTGSTDLALKNLILVTDLTSELFLVNIVLGSADNFADTKTLISQVLINN